MLSQVSRRYFLPAFNSPSVTPSFPTTPICSVPRLEITLTALAAQSVTTRTTHSSPSYVTSRYMLLLPCGHVPIASRSEAIGPFRFWSAAVGLPPMCFAVPCSQFIWSPSAPSFQSSLTFRSPFPHFPSLCIAYTVSLWTRTQLYRHLSPGFVETTQLRPNFFPFVRLCFPGNCSPFLSHFLFSLRFPVSLTVRSNSNYRHLSALSVDTRVLLLCYQLTPALDRLGVICLQQRGPRPAHTAPVTPARVLPSEMSPGFYFSLHPLFALVHWLHLRNITPWVVSHGAYLVPLLSPSLTRTF